MILGAVGKSGSGKTTWAKMFEERGVTRVSLDEVARGLDRKALGAWVLDPSRGSELDKLNGIYRDPIRAEVGRITSRPGDYIVEGYDLPRGFEVDVLYWVLADERDQIARLQAREPNTPLQALKHRLKVQEWPQDRASNLVLNMGTLDELRERFEYEYSVLQFMELV
jgi:dephospho-CoA kinase